MTNSEDLRSRVERRLDQDLAEVAALGRGGVPVDPGSGPEAVVEALRGSADRLGFASPVDAAAHVLRRLDELPAAERGNPVPAYHASASQTVRGGQSAHTVIDGELHLLFERDAPVTPLATVSLAALVRVAEDDTAYLVEYGWPAPPAQPVHAFAGTSEELLERARVDLADEEVPLEQSLLLLWGARIGSAEPVGTQEQRLLVAEGAAVRCGEVRGLLARTEQLASGPAEEWYAACLYRSVLENLFEGFLGAATFSLVEPEEIDRLDERLKEHLLRIGGAVPEAVPEGVPEGHWWWRAPFVGS